MQKLKKLIQIYRDSNVIVRAGIWFMLVTIIDKGIAVLTQPIINRILSVDEVGIVGVYTSWRSVFSVLATFNLFGGVLEVNLTKTPEEKDNAVASLCSLSLFISMVFWGIFFVFGRGLSDFMGLKPVYMLIMALAVTAEAIIQFWAVPKRFEYSYKSYAILIVGLFFFKSVLSVLLAYLLKNDRVLGRILGLAVPAVLIAVVLLFIIFGKKRTSSLFSYWKKGFLFNLPLIPHYLSSILLASSDRIMIQQLNGESDVGLYTVAYSFASLTLIVFNALNSTYNPVSMKAIKDKNYTFLRKMTEVIVVLSVMFSVFMMLLAPEGLWLLGGDKYLSAMDIIPILIVGIYLSSFYFVFSNVEFVYEKNKMIFPITLLGAIINIVLNFFLVRLYGYKAAAYTTFVGYLFIAIAHYIVSERIVKEDIYNIKRLSAYVVILLAGGALSMFLYTVNNVIRYCFILVMFIVMTWVLYKNRESIMKMIKKKDPSGQ